jgi:hypothetical protein
MAVNAAVAVRTSGVTDAAFGSARTPDVPAELEHPASAVTDKAPTPNNARRDTRPRASWGGSATPRS